MKQNMGTADRLIRGLIVAPGALVWAALAEWTTAWGIVALVVTGIMLITAAKGFCPLYAVLGITTARRRGAAHA